MKCGYKLPSNSNYYNIMVCLLLGIIGTYLYCNVEIYVPIYLRSTRARFANREEYFVTHISSFY